MERSSTLNALLKENVRFRVLFDTMLYFYPILFCRIFIQSGLEIIEEKAFFFNKKLKRL
jgi:hypothetical protein